MFNKYDPEENGFLTEYDIGQMVGSVKI